MRCLMHKQSYIFNLDYYHRPPQDRKALAKRCLPERGDLGGLNATDLEAMGCAILGLSKKDLDDIPVSALRGAIGTIRDCLEEADSDFVCNLTCATRKEMIEITMESLINNYVFKHHRPHLKSCPC